MTETLPAAAVLEDIPHVVPVRIVASPVSENDIADIVSFQTIITIGANDVAQQLITRSLKRSRAYIRVSAGNAANTNGYILLGTQSQVQQGLGFRLYNALDYTHYSKAEVWVRGDGTNSLAVSVSDERYSE